MEWNYLSIPKLQRCNRWSVEFHPTVYNGCSYLSMLGLNLNHVGKRVPRSVGEIRWFSYRNMASLLWSLVSQNFEQLQGLLHQMIYELIIQILWNLCCFFLNDNDQIRPLFCTCHESPTVMTYANLWPDWIIRIMINSERIIFTRFHLWPPKVSC